MAVVECPDPRCAGCTCSSACTYTSSGRVPVPTVSPAQSTALSIVSRVRHRHLRVAIIAACTVCARRARAGCVAVVREPLRHVLRGRRVCIWERLDSAARGARAMGERFVGSSAYEIKRVCARVSVSGVELVISIAQSSECTGRIDVPSFRQMPAPSAFCYASTGTMPGHRAGQDPPDRQ